MRALKIRATAILILQPTFANATMCEQFVARVIEGAAYDKAPVPAFDLEWVSVSRSEAGRDRAAGEGQMN
jgi:hypothetical protein